MALHERGLVAEVAPVLVPEAHEFARTAGAENVVQIVARDAGRLVLRGSGAGAEATRSAVMGDVVAVLRGLRHRRDPFARSHQLALDPAIDVEPFFANLARIAEIPHLRLWDDAVTSAPAARLGERMMREETIAIGALELDCGAQLPTVEQRVTIYGTPRDDGSNVVLIEHALTGSSRAAEWWPVSSATARSSIRAIGASIGINALGSCYGSTGAGVPRA